MDSVSIVLGISGTHVRQAMRTAWKSLMQQVSPIIGSAIWNRIPFFTQPLA